MNTVHTISHISLVAASIADNLGSKYASSLRKRDIPDNLASVKLPSLAGSGNWRTFKEKIILKLSTIKTNCGGISLEYIADTITRTVTHANAAKILGCTLCGNDEDLIRTGAMNFGTYFKDDNANVAGIFKKVLVSTPACNHIDKAISAKDVKGAICSHQVLRK